MQTIEIQIITKYPAQKMASKHAGTKKTGQKLKKYDYKAGTPCLLLRTGWEKKQLNRRLRINFYAFEIFAWG